VKDLLDIYDINKISAFIADNTTNNNTLVEALTEFNIDALLRIRYLGYIINLVVKAYLFSIGFLQIEASINRLSDSD
jgi:hypothetical protein